MRITIQEASELLQIPPQGIRELMKREIIDIGIVRPPAKRGGRNTYYIYREKVEELLKAKSPRLQS